MLRTLAAVVVMLLGDAANAAGYFLDGNELHDMCKTDPPTADAYVAGAYDSASALDEWHNVKPTICAPAGVNSRQFRDVVCRELEQHPEKRQKTAASLAVSALQEAFPCSDNP